MTVRRRIVVGGRVQGVGFRVNCAREAQRLGVGGSVRNLPDGSVEVLVEGEAAAVEALETWCRTGPSFARVESVEGIDEPPQGFVEFRIVG